MPTQQLYDAIANYYDLTHADLTEDIPFVLKLARESGGPVLELGCGSGRLTLPIAAAGISVTGLDSSQAMLARAQQKLPLYRFDGNKTLQFVTADMTDFALDNRFPLILIPYNTFMHLDAGQAAATLQRVKAHLAGDGRLFIDLANPFAVANTPEDNLLSLENTLIDPENGDVILHLAANRLDLTQQVLHITWIYDRSPAASGPVQRTAVQADYHFWYPQQLLLLLQEAGFKDISQWGDYEMSSFSETSERLLILAA